MSPTAVRVVYACVHNCGRSVIARLLTEHYAGGTVEAISAGTQPGPRVYDGVTSALAEVGLDTSRERPKRLREEIIATSVLVVTLGCGEECPYVPGVRYVDWPVADPAGQPLPVVRRIVADLDERVRDLLRELVPGIRLPRSVRG